jgi:hypothetical protein
MAVGSVLLSGCGLALTKGPPSYHATATRFDCTESMTGPMLDLLGAGVMVTAGLILWNADSSEEDPKVVGAFVETFEKTAAIAYSIPAAGMIISHSIGRRRVSRCQEALQELDARRQSADSTETPDLGLSLPLAKPLPVRRLGRGTGR